MNGVKITIDEWAGENGIELTENQIDDLYDAISIAIEMEKPGGYCVAGVKEENGEVQKLKNKLDVLTRFVRSKGYCVYVEENFVEIEKEVPCGSCHYANEREIFR